MSSCCPIHGVPLVEAKTRYGLRRSCPEQGCTVAHWGGSTSTPADAETRRLRVKAHAAFDPLWKSRRWSRIEAYRGLANDMGIPIQQCHIGMFNAEQCRHVIAFCKEVL